MPNLKEEKVSVGSKKERKSKKYCLSVIIFAFYSKKLDHSHERNIKKKRKSLVPFKDEKMPREPTGTKIKVNLKS